MKKSQNYINSKKEKEALEIFLENNDGNFGVIYYNDNFIFTNDYNETLSIINEESSSVWNRWKKFFESEYQNKY